MCFFLKIIISQPIQYFGWFIDIYWNKQDDDNTSVPLFICFYLSHLIFALEAKKLFQNGKVFLVIVRIVIFSWKNKIMTKHVHKQCAYTSVVVVGIIRLVYVIIYQHTSYYFHEQVCSHFDCQKLHSSS